MLKISHFLNIEYTEWTLILVVFPSQRFFDSLVILRTMCVCICLYSLLLGVHSVNLQLI